MKLLNIKGNYIIFFSLILLSFGCARNYKSMSLNAYHFSNEQMAGDSLKVSYLYDIQRVSNNKRYWRKEINKNLAAIGIKIENVSTGLILLEKEKFKVYADGQEKGQLKIEDYTKRVKQNVATHLLHTLWGPWQYSYSEDLSTGESDSEFKIIPIGAIVGIANAAIAGTANGKHRTSLENHELWNNYIKPGETIYGIILIESYGYRNLTFNYK